MDRRRVVVTGIGMINPMGHDAKTVWQGLQAGQSGVGYTTLFDASGFPTKISAEVKDWELTDSDHPLGGTDQLGRHTKFAIGAAKQAVNDSGVESVITDPTRFGIYLGSGEGNQDFITFSRMMTAAIADGEFDASKFIAKGLELLDPAKELEQEPNMPAAHLATMFNAQGPNLNCLTACAASSQAVGEATEIIRRGDADVMLAGGTHSMIHPFGVTGFNLLTALSESNDEPTKASRPFDRLRNGFVLGEGSAMVVLEELESARKRGATIYGEIAGYGTTADAYRITDIPPDGHGGIAAMRMSIADAGLQPSDIRYVNAHGTSTLVNDKVETLACKEVFGENAAKVPVSSTKSMMGHLIAAAGVTEMIVCLLAMRDSVLPPTINYENPDPACDLDYVPNEARPAEIPYALNNSFGFGGQNVTLCLARDVA
ncbi:beta-ketoacyl-[acyl-carrier-protein] synthase family protein [Roseiconus lacunae]|uniref:3-oxoacyl-[acyl-carrier-protein] synthase 2 n=1 Tax=Roseiconus lacunae TaxID=2605694 RepID=A0ABT7PKC4_9BACT|nr:beta-ketoacyl-[acyl-carrier-protein] synthase family protein [Roseiconus lacunae]MCD0461049.1 beta-ketoacyl-[acyl-carrier-protein] synthase family protein [Roseiconus lacunae]MDM4016952.1 beta-ketoacyl-[acyl-carrier-protein] synthase family protein [Roseiconus lacunae]WRQ48887.1 beta-ketoacyl-[acyl-carrier-protein] synthase family protein [Stieleria sp. HD01]